MDQLEYPTSDTTVTFEGRISSCQVVTSLQVKVKGQMSGMALWLAETPSTLFCGFPALVGDRSASGWQALD